jgi:hypothetical protein
LCLKYFSTEFITAKKNKRRKDTKKKKNKQTTCNLKYDRNLCVFINKKKILEKSDLLIASDDVWVVDSSL